MRYDEGIKCGTDEAGIAHEWLVLTTFLQGFCLVVKCAKCGRHGVVRDPSAAEWSNAIGAATRPYGWHDDARVKILPPSPFAGKALRCQVWG